MQGSGTGGRGGSLAPHSTAAALVKITYPKSKMQKVGEESPKIASPKYNSFQALHAAALRSGEGRGETGGDSDEEEDAAGERMHESGEDWAALEWAGVDWTGLDWIGLQWIGLGWIGMDWIGLDRI